MLDTVAGEMLTDSPPRQRHTPLLNYGRYLAQHNVDLDATPESPPTATRSRRPRVTFPYEMSPIDADMFPSPHPITSTTVS